jgi:Holliday junction resolvasome RuvABC endonuclease subunit
MKIVGVDLGIKKVALGFVTDGKVMGTEAYDSNSSLRTRQLMDISDYVYNEVRYCEPDYVFIESTIIGNNRKYSIKLAETMGAVLSGLGQLQTEQDFDVLTVNNKTWKKAVIGNGNALKSAVRGYLDGIAPYADLCGGDQDRYDAAVVGLYGWGLTNSVDQLRSVSGSER